MEENQIRDICTFMLSKAVDQARHLDREDVRYQQGFNDGCKFMADVAEEFRRRENELSNRAKVN